MFELIITKGELYDKCENMEELYDNFYYPLLVEYKELKKQVENYKKLGFKHLQDKNNKLEKQQEEFISYLENEVYTIEPKGTGINYNCEYDSEEDYISAMKECSKLNTLKYILQKYKEIIGVSDENNIE